MGEDKILKTIRMLRECFPTTEEAIYCGQNGRCYQVALLLTHLYPELSLVYDRTRGHAYATDGKKFYDISGVCHGVSPDESHTDLWRKGHKPHRWKI